MSSRSRVIASSRIFQKFLEIVGNRLIYCCFLKIYEFRMQYNVQPYHMSQQVRSKDFATIFYT